MTGNILDNNRHNLKIIINYDEYWDFIIDKNRMNGYSMSKSEGLWDKCLLSYIDFTKQEECVDGEWIQSTNDYRWESAVTSTYTLYNIGYTGVDNGLIQFKKDRITNSEFIKIYSESDFNFFEGDTRLKLHAVSGNTMKYEYPYTVLEDKVKLNGGFYQGVFKTECDKYQILPSTVKDDIWNFEFVLNKTEFEKESNKTLNDSHPNNKGIFFYLGTRAENKWVNLYEKETDCAELGVGDFVEDGEIDKSSWIISNFTDTDFYVDREMWRIKEEESRWGFNMDNFLDYIYYPDEVYKQYLPEDDYDEIYIDFETPKKPIIINDKTLAKDLEECCKADLCGKKKEIVNKIITHMNCCGCGKCKTYSAITTVEISKDDNCGWCHAMDDYLLDIDEVFFESDEDYNYVEPELDISAFDFQTANYGISLMNFRKYKSLYTDNKFLLFHRCGGFTTRNWVEDTIVEYRQKKNNFKGNLFLLMNRTCTGYTVATIDTLRDEYDEKYNIYNDLYNNALAFRITDEGEIGYRYLTVDCDIKEENKTKIIEGYSFPNVITENTWHTIHVKLYGKLKTMFMKFYVDGKLIYVTDEIPLLNLRKLAENDEKQELVPFNLSLGGGSQGLCDTILPNYMVTYDTVYPIEENFAGTFIGYIQKFRWFNCNMEYMNILGNFKWDKLHFRK